MVDNGLVEKSVWSIFWSYFSFLSTKVLNLVAIIILARLLSPAEFGLMAFCIVIIAYFEIFSRFGLGAALISASGDWRPAADAVFALSVTFSIIMAALLSVSSGTIAGFFEQPELASILQVLSIALVIEALPIVNNSLLQRELRFKLKMVPEVARGLVKGSVSIALALLDYGIWSLVLGHLAGAAMYSLVLFRVQPWRPAALPQWAVSCRMLKFGVQLIGAETINGLGRTLDSLLVGKILGAAPLGLYNLAFRIPELAIKSFTLVAGSVAHPIMAQMQDDTEALRKYFYGCLRYFALLTFAGGAVVAVLAEPLVHILYTPVWYDMIEPMRYLAIAFAIATVNLLPGSIYKAINRPGYLLRVSIINLPVFVTTLWIVVPYGLEAVSIAQICLAVFYFVPNFFTLRSAIGITLPECFAAILPGLTCAIITAFAGLAAQYLVAAPEIGELIFAGAVAGCAYLIALRFVSPEVFSEILRLISKRRQSA